MDLWIPRRSGEQPLVSLYLVNNFVLGGGIDHGYSLSPEFDQSTEYNYFLALFLHRVETTWDKLLHHYVLYILNLEFIHSTSK